MAESYFLDTSFILRALVDNNYNANSFFYTKLVNDRSAAYINVLVLSELIHALERIYYNMDYPPEKSAFSPVGLKKWRKAQKGAYKYVISEYRSIIKVLKDMVDLKIINVNVLNGDFECLLNEKIKFPELDANDCVHLVCAKKHCENIDCIVTCDKDFKSLIGKSTVKIHHINR